MYGLDKLRYLSLANNRIDYIASDGWDPLEKLEELDMRSNKLQLLDRESLCSLPQLRFLYLQDNKISHIDGEEGDGYCSLRTFSDVPLLEELYLDGNEISHTIEVSTLNNYAYCMSGGFKFHPNKFTIIVTLLTFILF